MSKEPYLYSGNSLSLSFIKGLLIYIILAVVCAISTWAAWTGFSASDDEYYVAAGLGWLHQFPYVATHFGTIRASVAIPIAIMIGVFGESEFIATLSTILFLYATGVLTFHMLLSVIGLRVALQVSIIFFTIPLFSLKATTPGADIPELFFVTASFWLFWKSLDANSRYVPLLLSGACIGAAFSAHELSSALIIFYGILFFIGKTLPRSQYFWLGLGFLAVLAIEVTYYWILTGNPLYRFDLLLRGMAASNDRAAVAFLETASGGTLHIWDPIDPVVMLFTHHNFSILGWLSIPAIWRLLSKRVENASTPLVLARLSLGLALVWLAFNAIMLRNIIVLPRYYMVTAYLLLIVWGVWLSSLQVRNRNVTQGLLIGLFVLSNALCIAVDNKNPKFAERALVEYLKDFNRVIYTDPLTADDATWYCKWEGVDCNKILGAPAPAGSLYFHNPKNTSKPNRFVAYEDLRKYQVDNRWERILVNNEKPSFLVSLLHTMRLNNLIPEKIWKRLSTPNPPVSLYLVKD